MKLNWKQEGYCYVACGGLMILGGLFELVRTLDVLALVPVGAGAFIILLVLITMRKHEARLRKEVKKNV